MIEIIGIVIAMLGLVFAFEAPRRWVGNLFRSSNSTKPKKAKSADLSNLELQILTILSEPHRDVPRTDYISHRLKTHEYNVRMAGKNLEKKGIIHFCHFSPEDEYGFLLHEQGRKFLVDKNLLD